MARSFNGSTQSASVVQDLSSVNKLTLSFWGWVDTFGNGDNMFLEYTASASANQNAFWIDPCAAAGNFSVRCNGGGATGNAIKTFTRPSGAAWHNYVCLLDISTGTASVTVYVDGVVQGSPATGAITAANFANSSLFVMSRNNSTLRLAGRMADLALYGGYLLTAGEAFALGTGAARPWQVGSSATLFRYWPMDGLVSPEPQMGGAGLNLSLTAAPPAIQGPPMTAFTPRWPQGLDATAAAFNPYWATGSNVIYEGGNVS